MKRNHVVLTLLLFLSMAADSAFGQTFNFAPGSDTGWVGASGWKLSARTGRNWNALGTQKVPTSNYITDNIAGFLEYLPVGYNPNDPNTKYPVIIYFPGCGEVDFDGYLFPYGGVPSYDWGLGRMLGPTIYRQDSSVARAPGLFRSLPRWLKEFGDYFSNIPVKKKGEVYNTATGPRQKAIVICIMYNGDPIRFTNGSPVVCSRANGPTVDDVEAALTLIKSKYNYDPNKLFLTGMSLGASVSWEYPAWPSATHSLAAAAPVAAFRTIGSDAAKAQLIKNRNIRMLVETNLYDYNTNGTAIDVITENQVSARTLSAIAPTLIDTNFFLNRSLSGYEQTPGLTSEADIIAQNQQSHDAWGLAFTTDGYEGNDQWPYIDTITRGTTPIVEKYTLYEWFLQQPVGTLPVSLASFTARKQSVGVQLSWVTSSESNSRDFRLERSVNGVDFTPIATLPAAGNTNLEQRYGYLDKDLPDSRYVYYRLIQTDRDDRWKDLGTRKVFLNSAAVDFKVYPTVTTGSLVMEINGSLNQQLNVTITDMAGRLLSQRTVAPRQSRVSLDVSNLSRGMYIIRATSTDNSFTQKFIKQ